MTAHELTEDIKWNHKKILKRRQKKREGVHTRQIKINGNKTERSLVISTIPLNINGINTPPPQLKGRIIQLDETARCLPPRHTLKL